MQESHTQLVQSRPSAVSPSSCVLCLRGWLRRLLRRSLHLYNQNPLVGCKLGAFAPTVFTLWFSQDASSFVAILCSGRLGCRPCIFSSFSVCSAPGYLRRCRKQCVHCPAVSSRCTPLLPVTGFQNASQHSVYPQPVVV